MSPDVDARAAVHPEAHLGPRARVGPFAIVESGVEIGEDSVIHGHAVVRAGTHMGARNVVHAFAVLGGPPQDRRHDGSSTRLVIGDDNEFREHVTVHRGTSHGGGRTRIGNHGLFMVGTHVAHDVTVGDHVTLTNGTLVGGHATIGDHVVTGGHAAIAPFVEVGESAFLAAGAMVERSIPPFVIAAGDRARVRALNRVGLGRRDVPEASRRALRAAFRSMFRGASPLRSSAQALLGHEDPWVQRLAEFVVRVSG